MKNKILFVLLIAILTVSLISCSSKPTDIITDDTATNTETDTTDTSDAVDTADAADTEAAIGGGESDICPVHDFYSFHGVPYEIEKHIDPEEYSKWWEERNNLFATYDREEWAAEHGGCYYTSELTDAIQDFGITDEQILDAYYNGGYYYVFDWDIDTLLSGDYEAFDEYCRRYKEHESEMKKRATEQRLKMVLLTEIQNSTNTDWQSYYTELTKDNDT